MLQSRVHVSILQCLGGSKQRKYDFMRRLLGEQLRMLHRGCKILVFEFDFQLMPEYKLVLEYNNEMNKQDVADDIATPIRVNVSQNSVFFKFRPCMEDRAYELEIWGPDDNTIKLGRQLDNMIDNYFLEDD